MKRNVAAQKIRRSRTKRQKQQKFVLRRRIWGFVGFLSICILVSLGFFLFSSVQTFWSEFQNKTQKNIEDFLNKRGCYLKKIDIEGIDSEEAEALKKKLGLEVGTPSLQVKPWLIKEQLEKSPLIHMVLVERRFPDEIYIKISERVPMARWQHKRKIKLIDHQGRVMPLSYKQKISQNDPSPIASPLQKLPLFIGKEAPEKGILFLKKIQRFEEITRQITALNNISNRRWTIYLNGDLEVKLPEEDTDSALKKLCELEREGLLTIRKVQMIDLRYLPKVIIRPREGVTLENIFKKPAAKPRSTLDLGSLNGNNKET